MGKLSKLQLLLASVLLSACSEIVESSYEDPQWDTDDASSSCVDEGPSYTDQMLDLSRDGKDGGRVSIRFYSDKPNVPYITVSDFHEIMTDGESMRVVRDGDLYLLSTREGMATVDVEEDYLYSMNYGALVDLSFLVAPNLSPNTMYDASKLSYSCGNQFAAMMKDSGFTIMGERSGGGSCSFVSMLTPDGINYTLSTYRDRSTFKDFVNIDLGVPLTDGYAFGYTHFYDLDYLTTQMQK